MAATQHGRHIPGTTWHPNETEMARARCGGPGLCEQCTHEAHEFKKSMALAAYELHPEDMDPNVSTRPEDQVPHTHCCTEGKPPKEKPEGGKLKETERAEKVFLEQLWIAGLGWHEAQNILSQFNEQNVILAEMVYEE